MKRIYLRMHEAKLMVTLKFKYFGVPKLETKQQLNTSFPKRFGSAWTWKEMLWQNFITRNFITDNWQDIKLLDCYKDPNDCFNYIFEYEYKGKVYKTTDTHTRKPEVKRECKPVVNDIRIVDYSDKAIAVIGGTYEIKEEFKEIGARFNKFLKVNGKIVPGWILPKTKE